MSVTGTKFDNRVDIQRLETASDPSAVSKQSVDQSQVAPAPQGIWFRGI
jgi:hypothetical protein